MRPSPVNCCVDSSSASSDDPFSLARPTSSTFTRPLVATMTLAGFRSRCTMPRSCATLTASAMAIASLRKTSIGSPFPGILADNGSPSTSSIVRKWTPLSSSTEWIVTMLGWLNAATAASQLPGDRRDTTEVIRQLGHVRATTSAGSRTGEDPSAQRSDSEHFGQHDAEGPDVGAMVDRASSRLCTRRCRGRGPSP